MSDERPTVHPIGSTRSAVRQDHAVIAPDSHVRSPLPGWSGSSAIILISPRLGGAEFSQILVEMGPGTESAPPAPEVQRFVWVVDGAARVDTERTSRDLSPGGYALLPADDAHAISTTSGATVLLIEKPYIPLDEDAAAPALVMGTEADVASAPLQGDPDLQVRQLIPEDPSYDMAVNTMTFTPGASLPFVEAHSMEHGLLMLEGTMVYRLGEAWYVLQAGDVVYMAPYCQQWAVAYGKTPAKYLIYKDWHRDPLLQS